MIFKLIILIGLIGLSNGFQNFTTISPIHTSPKGGSSISGMLVTCHTSLENCLEACYMSCYFADLCNDIPDMTACAPGLSQMVILTIVFVILVTTCCGLCCFFAPCCCCAIIYKGYRARRAGRAGRHEPDNNVAFPSAPPLIAKV